MNYIVLDLEFNQTYDFNDGKTYEPNPNCPFEIIQIGAVKLNSKFEIVQKFNILIKPQIYKKVHPIVEKLTNLNDKQLENQVFFPKAYSNFIKFIGGEMSTLCIWGPYDIKALYKNIMFYNLNHNNLKPTYINVQSMASQYLKYPSGVSIGLKNAVENFGLSLDKSFHDALNDAIYTAHIFQKLKDEPFNTASFNVKQLSPSKDIRHTKINVKLLYNKVEKDLGRKLTQKEKKVFRNIYLLGRKKQYDI